MRIALPSIVDSDLILILIDFFGLLFEFNFICILIASVFTAFAYSLDDCRKNARSFQNDEIPRFSGNLSNNFRKIHRAKFVPSSDERIGFANPQKFVSPDYQPA